MSSISIVFRKDKLNKNNQAPVHFRIIKDRKIRYITTGQMIPFDNWDFKNNMVKSKHPNSARVNALIAKKFSEINDEMLKMEGSIKSLSVAKIKAEVYGKKAHSFFDIADRLLITYWDKENIGTHDKCKSIVTKLKKYLDNRDIHFQDIDTDFLTKYESYLRNTLNNKTNTVAKDLRFIRRVFNYGIRLNVIDMISPFVRYSIQTEKTKREYLSEDELKRIEELSMVNGERMTLHRDMFVFAAYSGGLRVSDILKLQWKDFDGIHINVYTQKTNAQISIKLPNKALEIISALHDQNTKPEHFIFPMLQEPSILKNPVKLDAAINSATAYINKNLKFIAIRANIQKPLSFHISRHTWATRALRKGISIDKVSHLLTHSSLRETQIYAKIVGTELDKAMDVFND
jgi:integrase/recombinase XerD